MRLNNSRFIDGQSIEALMRSVEWRLASVRNDEHKNIETVIEIIAGAQAILEIAQEILFRGSFDESKPSLFKQREAHMSENDKAFLSMNAMYGKHGNGEFGAKTINCEHGILKILGCIKCNPGINSECSRLTNPLECKCPACVLKHAPERCPHGYMRDLSKIKNSFTLDDICPQCVSNRP